MQITLQLILCLLLNGLSLADHKSGLNEESGYRRLLGQATRRTRVVSRSTATCKGHGIEDEDTLRQLLIE